MLFWIVLLALGGIVAGALVVFWQVIGIGAAYRAKVLATETFGCGRTLDPVSAIEISADAYSLLRLFPARVDPATASATASFFGIRRRTARWRPGLGAALVYDGYRPVMPPLPVATSLAAAPWPRRAGSSSLNAAVLRAFTEPHPARLRRTRAVVVLRGGDIVAEHYAAPFTTNSLFAGWSMTKGVLAALVGILVSDGRLALSDRELLPAWRAPDPRADISLEDLLRMRSGLRFREVYTQPFSDVLRMLYTVPDAVAYAARLPLIATPGTQWSYSSGTTNILSGIARRVLGDNAYVAWPRHALFDRIGMHSAQLEADAAGTFLFSSYMLATASDWARMGQLHLQNGVWEGTTILPEDWVRFCTTPTPQSPTANYGAHWWLKLQPDIGGNSAAVARVPKDAFFAVGHEGQTLTVIPSLDLVIVRLGLSIYIDAWNQAEFVADIVDAL